MPETCHHLTGLIVLAVLAAIGVALSGYLCLQQGRATRRRDDYDEGHRRGWDEAHTRIARALQIDPKALNLMLLELETADLPPIPGTSAGEAMVALHRSKRPPRDDRDLSVGWGVESFS